MKPIRKIARNQLDPFSGIDFPKRNARKQAPPAPELLGDDCIDSQIHRRGQFKDVFPLREWPVSANAILYRPAPGCGDKSMAAGWPPQAAPRQLGPIVFGPDLLPPPAVSSRESAPA